MNDVTCVRCRCVRSDAPSHARSIGALTQARSSVASGRPLFATKIPLPLHCQCLERCRHGLHVRHTRLLCRQWLSGIVQVLFRCHLSLACSGLLLACNPKPQFLRL